MPAPDWRALRLVLDDRAVIVAEEFPATLTAVGSDLVETFSHDEAQGLLYTFAWARPVLGHDASDPHPVDSCIERSAIWCVDFEGSSWSLTQSSSMTW